MSEHIYSYWQEQAGCLEIDPETFFVGDVKKSSENAATAEAKAACGKCAVTAACLKWALDTGQNFGIWGGMTTADRSQFKRRSKRIGSSGV